MGILGVLSARRPQHLLTHEKHNTLDLTETAAAGAVVQSAAADCKQCIFRCAIAPLLGFFIKDMPCSRAAVAKCTCRCSAGCQRHHLLCCCHHSLPELRCCHFHAVDQKSCFAQSHAGPGGPTGQTAGSTLAHHPCSGTASTYFSGTLPIYHDCVLIVGQLQ
jgi:hypothetical protein